MPLCFDQDNADEQLVKMAVAFDFFRNILLSFNTQVDTN